MLKHNSDTYLAGITNASGESVQFSYSKDGLLESLIDANGNSYGFTYDRSGRLVQRKDATGAVTRLASKRDRDSSLVVLISPTGRESTYLVERLPSGEERRVNKCCGGSEIIELRGSGNSRTITYPEGTMVKTIEERDGHFHIRPFFARSEIKTPAGLTCTITANRRVGLREPKNTLSFASLTDSVEINGRTFGRMFDGGSRILTETTPSGRQIRVTFDSGGRATQFEWAGLLPVKLRYDKRGYLMAARQGSAPHERSVTFSYNSEGGLENITDSFQQTARVTYDTAGRTVTQTLPDRRAITFAYDANGNLASITPPGRPSHVFTYTAADLISGYMAPTVGAGGNETTYAYNPDRQLTTITRPDSRTLSFVYDSAGRLSTLSLSGGIYTYTWDPATGDLVNITAPGGVTLFYAYDGSLLKERLWAGAVAGSVSQTYDNNFRMTSQSINGASTIKFTYDNDTLLTAAGGLRLTRSAENGLITGTMLDSISDTSEYNGFGELLSYSAAHRSRDLYLARYTYDRIGRIVQKNETIDGRTATYNYSYDSAGQLTEVKNTATTAALYSYDSNGNRLCGPTEMASYTYDAQDRLIEKKIRGTHSEIHDSRYTYNANGELQSKTSSRGDTTKYRYDDLGNLLQVALPGGPQVDYVVDGRNRRVRKKVNGTPSQGFLYGDQLTPVAELDGSNNIMTRFVYASRANVPDYMIKNGVTYRIISDHLGSVRLIVEAASGTIVQRLDFDEFGSVVTDTNPGFQPFAFAGGLYDPHTKFIRFGARDYDADIGRWTAKDPILFASGDTNLYRYVFNDPINFSDPTGNQQGKKTAATWPGLSPDSEQAALLTSLKYAALAMGQPEVAAGIELADKLKTGIDAISTLGEVISSDLQRGYGTGRSVLMNGWSSFMLGVNKLPQRLLQASGSLATGVARLPNIFDRQLRSGEQRKAVRDRFRTCW